MNIIILIGINFFFIRFLFFLFGLILNYLNLIIFIEWVIFSINSLDYKFIFIFDWISLFFISLVFFISSFIFFYRVEYIDNEGFKIKYFYILLFMFVISIFFIVLSPNILRILLGWDGLGLTSFFLVIYYQNSVRFFNGIITILLNRIGDLALIIRIVILIHLGNWNIIFLDNIDYYVIFFLVLASLTKRAQFPFSSWLPAAISAPTPVSSLVHSSTLVTAGVYLIIRYNNFLLLSNLNYRLFILACLTSIISGFCAIYEYDLKKIVAISTLSQLGYIIIILRLGNWKLAFFHLFIHALFKSLLFISSGKLIHLSFNNQDIRKIGGLFYSNPILSFVFLTCLLRLMGFPFFSGFYTKDLIIEWIFIISSDYVDFILFICSVLTIIYRLRLIYYILWGNYKFYPLSIYQENNLIIYSIVILTLVRIIGGRLFYWLLFFNINFIFVNINIKLFIILIMFLSYFFFKKIILLYIYKIYNKIFLVENSYFWYLDIFYTVYRKDYLYERLLLINYMENSFIENYFGKNIYLFNEKFFNLDFKKIWGYVTEVFIYIYLFFFIIVLYLIFIFLFIND